MFRKMQFYQRMLLIVVAWSGLMATPQAFAAYIQIEAGAWHTCGIKDDGSAICWGSNSYGQTTTVPSGTFTQLSAGGNHTCGIKSDGSAVCWGDNQYGQSTAPSGTFTQLSAGFRHTCGLTISSNRAPFTVCWGDNQYGQRDPPPLLFSQISAGGFHTCGLSSGDIFCWGAGQTIDTTGNATVEFGQSIVPEDKSNWFTQVSASGYHTCGLKDDGSASSAICWGTANHYGQTTVPTIPSGIFTQLSTNTGDMHTCGLSFGNAYCWGAGKTDTDKAGGGGWSEYGQSINPIGAFTQISTGTLHTCGLRSDGSAICWGAGTTNTGLNNEFGQSMVPVDSSTDPASSNGFLITSDIWINARINTEEKGLINAVWQKGGDSTTGRGDRVIWGYFYASPTDVSWGNEDNPDMFVKVWFDASGRIDVNFFHVSVPGIEVYSSKKSGGVLSSIATTDKRYVLHGYNSNNTQTASVIDTRNASVLKISFPTVYGIDDSPPSEIIIQTEEKGGIVAGGGFADVGDSGTTARGDIVGWGYYYAKPSDVSWGSRDNPEVFYKFWLDVSGRMDMNFFHVSVPEIVVSSLASDTKGNRSPTYRSTVTLSNRYARHEYSPK